MEANVKSSFLDVLKSKDEWESFLKDKIDSNYINKWEQDLIRNYIDEEKYLEAAKQIEEGCYPQELVTKQIVLKPGSEKKRCRYNYSDDVTITLKYLLQYLFKYDDLYPVTCYSYRINHGVKQAVRKLKRKPRFANMYCVNAEIHNYLNAMNVSILLDRLSFVKEDDPEVYRIFERILSRPEVMYEEHIIQDNHGAMAGIPLTPFFANVYLRDIDTVFAENQIDYFRYDDHVMFFAESMEELERLKTFFIAQLALSKLSVSPSKISVKQPGEVIEFLGFACKDGELDLTDSLKEQMKARIKKKAEAARRWQMTRKYASDKAASALIRSMNKTFYGYDDEKGVRWDGWFFPSLTVTDGLQEIDRYMQLYIRYCITGKHYKGNYRITYDQMKKWGYKNLVNAYYKCHHTSLSEK